MIGEAALNNGPPASQPLAKLERAAFHFPLWGTFNAMVKGLDFPSFFFRRITASEGTDYE